MALPDTERHWAQLEMASAKASERPEFAEALRRVSMAMESGWTEREIASYWAGFIGAIEWYTSRMSGRK